MCGNGVAGCVGEIEPERVSILHVVERVWDDVVRMWQRQNLEVLKLPLHRGSPLDAIPENEVFVSG
jgi:hypothetical protein